jgi:hypothetical protein
MCGSLHCNLIVADMGAEKEINCTVRIWLENIDGEKCAETDGMYF